MEQEGVKAHPKSKGAEQGDVLGPVEAGVVLVDLATQTRREVHLQQAGGKLPPVCWEGTVGEARRRLQQQVDSQEKETKAWTEAAPAQRRKEGTTHPWLQTVSNGGIMDCWYLDDSTIFIHPTLVETYLVEHDRLLEERGAKRNMEKTKVILYARPDTIAKKRHAWKIDEVAKLATIVEPHDPKNMCLGIAMGGGRNRAEQFRLKAKLVQALHDRIRHVQECSIELSLASCCGSVCKINHLLRAAGDDLFHHADVLENFDRVQAATLERLFPGMDAEAHSQAALATKDGGLGLRKAGQVALSAVLASKAMAEPKVELLVKQLAKAGLIEDCSMLDSFRRGIDTATKELGNQLGSKACGELTRVLAEARAKAKELWARQLEGSTGEGLELSGDVDQDLDPESLHSGGGNEKQLSIVNLQKQMGRLLDERCLEDLVEKLRAQGRYQCMRRLEEQRDRGVNHAWIWAIDPARWVMMSEQDYVMAVRVRLGCFLQPSSFLCAECGAIADARGVHCECCAKAERTKGHYLAVRACMSYVLQADPAAQTEVQGLSEAQPDARPADFFTNAAVPNRDAAVDISIVSPEAGHAGADCVQTAFQKKRKKYKESIAEWEGTNITFQPMIWSHWGRPHHNTVMMMQHISSVIARRTGVQSKTVASRWAIEMGATLALRRARMARRILPETGVRGKFCVTGELPDNVFTLSAVWDAVVDNEDDGLLF